MKNVIISVLIMFLSFPPPALSQQDSLFYIGDPMCSWCYGFSPELDMVLENFPDVPFKIIVGGLRAHGDEKFTSLSTFLHEHWKEVENRTGQPFSYHILQNQSLVYNTEPACRAVVTVRSMSPKKEYPYFKLLQKYFYSQNEDPTSLETFVKAAIELGLDPEKFQKYFNSPAIVSETEKDFQLALTLNVTGFPSMVALKGGKLIRVSNGYVTAESLINKLRLMDFAKKH